MEQPLGRLSGVGDIANLPGTASMNLHGLVERLVLKRTQYSDPQMRRDNAIPCILFPARPDRHLN
jgi:hypothetical protein